MTTMRRILRDSHYTVGESSRRGGIGEWERYIAEEKSALSTPTTFLGCTSHIYNFRPPLPRRFLALPILPRTRSLITPCFLVYIFILAYQISRLSEYDQTDSTRLDKVLKAWEEDAPA